MTSIETHATVGEVRLPDAPPIAGLTFRTYSGLEDIPALVRVANAARDADQESDVVTVEGLTNEYANLTNSDPYRDVLIGEVDGEVVGYSRVEWLDETDGGRAYISFGFIDPLWRRHGIGRAMLHHNERLLREVAADHAHDRPRWFATWGTDVDQGNIHLLHSEDYVAVRHFYEMVRPDLEDIAVVPLPEGLEIRPVTESQMRQLFDADVEAFRDHWGPHDESEASFRRWLSEPTFDPSLYVVAWDGDEIAGAVVNSIYPEENERRGYRRGWLDSVFTRRSWRRRGVARALIARSFVLLKARGMTSASLGVDATNPHEAVRLYEESGFAVERRQTGYRKAFDPVIGREW